MIDKWLDEHTDTLDADVFTGDCLHEKINRDHLKHFLDRWNRELLTYGVLNTEEGDNT